MKTEKIGFCLKMIGDKQSGKTAEYIFAEHQQIALLKKHVWFSTNQHISNRNEDPSELLLFFVTNSGKPTAYRASIDYLLFEKEKFIPGQNARFKGAPFQKEIQESIRLYAPPAYAGEEACTWFYVGPFEEVGAEYMKEHALVSTNQPLSEVINERTRSPRALYRLERIAEEDAQE